MEEEHLRDFFAGLAMLGLMMSPDFREEDVGVDVTAYKLANAMIETRQNNQERSEP